MCGRYALIQPADLAEYFGTENSLRDLQPNYNVSPGQPMPVITRTGAELMRWGLVPVWAKDPKIGYKMINARAETVAEKPAFRASFKSRRCLVPVTGYYEWKQEGALKQPYFYRLPDRNLFAFAGLTADWHDEQGNELQSYTIITTVANSLAAEVHDRMPAILKRDDEHAWLDPLTPLAYAESLLKPYDPEQMAAYPVSSDVGNPRNNAPSLIEPRPEQPKPQAGPNSA